MTNAIYEAILTDEAAFFTFMGWWLKAAIGFEDALWKWSYCEYNSVDKYLNHSERVR